MIADEIVAAARELIGTPFVHQGRLPGVALDCAGTAIIVAQKIGFDVTDVIGYGRTPANGLLEKTVAGQPFLMPVKVSEIAAGDILVMRFGKEPRHLDVCAGDTLIPSYAAVRMVCEHRLSDVWRTRITAAYRFTRPEA